MITIDKIAKEVSKRLDLDYELVKTVCRHPFLFTVETMKDDYTTEDIMFNKLFKFKLKRRYKEDKTKQYSK